MKKTIPLLFSIFVSLGIGFLLGAYFANTKVISTVQADPLDETPGAMNDYYYYGGYRMGMMGPMYGYGMGPMYGYGMNNYSYYGGYGMGPMGMGMGMMGPMYAYGYGMDNDTYYNGYYGGYGMGMGMGMMGPMYGYGMYGYGYNGTYYGNYGYCPGCGGYGYGMYGGYPYYYDGTNPSMNMTSTSVEGSVVFLSDDANSETTSAKSVQATFAFSPLTIAGLGVGFLAFAPVSWKILHRRVNK
jgi:hypothetical protein